jgi:hypothetical protein
MVKDGKPLRYISLGAGVQSTTMALMAAAGEITPMPDCAIFADTQDEALGVYKHLQWLTGCEFVSVVDFLTGLPKLVPKPGCYRSGALPFDTHIVTAGSLSEAACRVRVSKKDGNSIYTRSSPPAYAKDLDGTVGFAMRQCTGSHKLEVLWRQYRKLRKGRKVEQWVGISKDEATRMKPPPESLRGWLSTRWPLIDLRMTRNDCIRWMEAHGYSRPPRSACVYCPYKNNSEWRELKSEHPADFAAAVSFEKKFQGALSRVTGFRGMPFLHRSCVPLDQADFSDPQDNQLNLFGNECEGMCGV